MTEVKLELKSQAELVNEIGKLTIQNGVLRLELEAAQKRVAELEEENKILLNRLIPGETIIEINERGEVNPPITGVRREK